MFHIFRKRTARLEVDSEDRSVRIIFKDESRSRKALSFTEAMFLIRCAFLEDKITGRQRRKLMKKVIQVIDQFALTGMSDDFRKYVRELPEELTAQISREIVRTIESDTK